MKLKRHQIEHLVPLVLSIISVLIFWRRFDSSVNDFLALGFTILGLSLWWGGKISLGENFRALHQAKEIIQKGPYKKIRHPIYLGISIMLIGWNVLLQNYFIIGGSLALIICLLTRAYYEEKLLEKKFGSRYKSYKKCTWF